MPLIHAVFETHWALNDKLTNELFGMNAYLEEEKVALLY